MMNHPNARRRAKRILQALEKREEFVSMWRSGIRCSSDEHRWKEAQKEFVEALVDAIVYGDKAGNVEK